MVKTLSFAWYICVVCMMLSDKILAPINLDISQLAYQGVCRSVPDEDDECL